MRSPALDVEREHEHLGAEAVGDLGDQRGAGDGGAVHADLVGAVALQLVDIVDAADPAANGERDENLFGGRAHNVEGRLAVVDGRRDIEEGEFVGALP